MTQMSRTCTDVIVAYQRARTIAGQDEALRIIHRFGARYAATILPEHYEAVTERLASLVEHHQREGELKVLGAKLTPADVKASWATKALADR